MTSTNHLRVPCLGADLAQPEPVGPTAIGPEWQPCVKLPITVHVREQRPGETHSSTREGITPLRPDDLIMRGVQGEEYPIGRELFNQTYRMGATLAQPEPAGPTSDELRAMAAEFAARTPEEFARAVLARWGWPAVAPEAGELSPREVEAQEAFTGMRDEILSRSEGLGVYEVLGVIDSFTPDWV